MFIYFWERGRESKQERSRDRGRHRIQSRLQVPSCQHRARRGAWTHQPWDHDLSWSQTLNWLSHPGTPMIIFLEEEKNKILSWSGHSLNSSFWWFFFEEISTCYVTFYFWFHPPMFKVTWSSSLGLWNCAMNESVGASASPLPLLPHRGLSFGEFTLALFSTTHFRWE